MYIAFAFSIILIAANPEDDSRPDRTEDGLWVSIPVARGGQPVIVPVTLAGKSFLFLCTHSDFCAFDTGLRSYLGEPIRSTSLKGVGEKPVRAEVVETPVLEVAGCKLNPRDGDVGVIADLSSTRVFLEQDIRGMIGTSLFRGRLVQFDFDEGMVRLADAEGAIDKSTLGQPWPLRSTASEEYWVDDVKIGDRTESFQVRWGDNVAVQVHSWLFDRLRDEGTLRESLPKPVPTHRGLMNCRSGLLSTMTWGDFELRDLWIDTAETNYLGLGFLARFIVTFDVADGHIYLRPGRRFNRPDSKGVAGFDVAKGTECITVTAVRKGSVADGAGVQAGDSIVEMNGVTCRQMRLLDFAWRMEESKGGRLELKLIRNGVLVHVSFEIPATMGEDMFIGDNR